MNEQIMPSAADRFGFNWWMLFSGAFSFAFVVAALALPLFATVHCLQHHRSNPQLPLWLLLVWLVPIAGPICAFAALRRPDPSPPQQR